MAEFVINVHKSSVTDHTPFELLYSYTPDFMVPPGKLTGMPNVDKRIQILKDSRIEAEAALQMSKDRINPNILKQPYKFKVGDKVWLQAKNIKLHQQSQKLKPKQLGPFCHGMVKVT